MSRDERVFFDEVYESVFPTLYRVVYRIVGNPDTAEEVCHDAFVRFFEHSTRLPDVEQARYWMLRVGKNLAFNVVKRRGREFTAVNRLPYEPAKPIEQADESLLREETIAQVRDALLRLPKSLRDVILLKEYGGLAYSEIARTLGISVANVKVRVHRARERLAGYLEGDDVHFPQ